MNEAEAIDAKVRAASKAGVVHGRSAQERLQSTRALGLVDANEVDIWTRYDALRRACIMVDDFAHDVGRHTARRGDGAAVQEPGPLQSPAPGAVSADGNSQQVRARDLQQERA